MDISEGREIPKEVIQSLFSFAYCEGILQGMGEAWGERDWRSRPISSEQVDELICRWLKVEEIREIGK